MLAAAVAYGPPVDYEVTLAGNFGEPRQGHFHGGIDVKTGGVKGKAVYSIADGYVSRLTTGLYGFGNAVYVTHPDGNTSVYCHLEKFIPRLARLVRESGGDARTAVRDVRLGPADCPVAQGELIAVSGNSGASKAPHLHLEIHDTRTGRLKDPLDFLKAYVRDTVPPQAFGVMACPVSGRGLFNGKTWRQSFGLSARSTDRRFTAWGQVRFALWANDYSGTAYNSLGVREVTLTVDGSVAFHSDIGRGMPAHCQRQIGLYADCEHYRKYRTWYMKSFCLPGSPLSCLYDGKDGGTVRFDEERDYRVEYTLTDAYGNVSSYAFTVRGQRAAIKDVPQREDSLMTARADRITSCVMPGAQLVLPAWCLAEDTRLCPTAKSAKRHDTDGQRHILSPQYSFAREALWLPMPAELNIAVEENVDDTTKLYISRAGDPDVFMGGTYVGGYVTTYIRDIGARYTLEYDDTPPDIAPLAVGRGRAADEYRFRVTDSGSGVSSCDAYIDGISVPVERTGKTVSCRLRDGALRKTGGARRLRIAATDNRDNTSEYETDIIY